MDFKKIDTGIAGDGKDIIYVDGTYYLVSIDPNGVATSEDLINWTFHEFEEANNNLDSIAYGNGIFVVACDTTGGIFTSNDGITWTHRNLTVYSKVGQRNIKAAFNTVRFVNNQFVIVTGTTWTTTHSDGTKTYRDEGHVLVSKNGINWTDKFECDESSLMEISYNNGLYVVVGTYGGIFTSNNLTAWQKRTSNTSLKLVGISYGKSLFVITGADGTILTSKNGIDWTKRKSNTNSYLIRSRYGNGLYVAVGYNAVVLTSIDGITWQEQDEGYTKGCWYGMVYSNNRYVITGNRLSNSGNIALVYFDISRDLPDYGNSCLFFYDTSLNQLGIIDEFISLRWRRKFFEAGEFTLVVSPDENNIRLLKPDNIIIRENYTEAAIIEYIEIEDTGDEIELKVSGRFLSSVFERRIIKNTINFSGEVINGMKMLIDNCIPISDNIEIEPTQLFSPSINFQCTYKNLYPYLVKLSKFSLIGFRLVPNVENKVFIFENYKGKDRTSLQSENEKYAFSVEQHNMERANFIFSTKTKYNYVLVGGQGEGSNRVLVSVSNGDHSGFDLRETFVDARNNSSNNLSASEYSQQLEDLGNQTISDEFYAFDTTVDTRDYKVKWDLGDIIDLEKEEWDITEQKMIVEIEEVYEDNVKSVSVVLGSPLPDEFEDKEV